MMQETKIEQLKNQLEGIKQNERTRKREIERLEKSTATVQEQLDNPPDHEDAGELAQERVRRALLSPVTES